MIPEDREAILAQIAELKAGRPTAGDLVRGDKQPWFLLADSRGVTPRVAEVGGRGGALGSIVISYDRDPDSWARVGWYFAREDLPPQIDGAEYRRRSLVDRLVLAAADVPEGQGHTAQRLMEAAHDATSPWSETTLHIDGHEHAAQSASVYEDQITFVTVDSRAVFVQTRRWEGTLGLCSGMDHPDLSSWADR